MKKLGLLVAPVLLALGCGGIDSLFDGGIDGGVTPFQVQSANYTQSATSTVSTTCGVIDPVAAQTALNGSQRHVYNDAMGNLCFETVVTSGQPVLIGCGMVSFNKGQLKSTGIAFNDGKCQWTSSTTIDITVTAKNTIKIDKFSQDRSQWGSVTAGSCSQVSACNVNWSATLTGP
jgi:hypothetical protein